MNLNAGQMQRALMWLSVACLAWLLPAVSAQEPKLRDTLKGHTLSVLSVAYSPDGKTLASGSDDRTIRLWDMPAAQKAGR
jgi:WD40 repeat protein